MHRIRIGAASALLLLPVYGRGQVPTRTAQAPRAICDFLNVASAEAQRIFLPLAVGEHLRVSVAFDGATRTLQLRRYDVRTPDFKLLIDDGFQLTQVPVPESVTYRGHLSGEPDSSVAATVVNGELRAEMRSGGRIWALQPVTDVQPGLAHGTYVIYEQGDVLDVPFVCSVQETRPVPQRPGVSGRAAAEDGAMMVAEIAIDADEPFYLTRNSSVVAVQNDITGILNAVDVIYNADLGIEHRIATMIVRTVPTYASSGSLLADEFMERWNQFHSGISRDTAHLFSGRSPTGPIGRATFRTLCTVDLAYGVSWSDFTTNQTLRVGITAHELAHNWGATHCDGDVDCQLMCSQALGCTGNIMAFGSKATQEIVVFKGSLPCLSTDTDPIQPPSLTAITPPSIVSFEPEIIFLTGANLDTVTSLTIAGIPVAFTPVAADSLRFTPPANLDIEAHEVLASNSAGSDSIDLTIDGVQPGLLDFPPFVLRNQPTTYRIQSDRGWQGVLGISLSNTPSSIPGVIDLLIGNDFLNIITIPVFADLTGTVEFELTIPDTILPFTPTYWQAVMFPDPFSLILPLQPTNLATVFVL